MATTMFRKTDSVTAGLALEQLSTELNMIITQAQQSAERKLIANNKQPSFIGQADSQSTTTHVHEKLIDNLKGVRKLVNASLGLDVQHYAQEGLPQTPAPSLAIK